MNYCEKCSVLMNSEVCDFCGNKNLREPRADDLCYFGDLGVLYANMLEDMLTNNQIKFVYLPVRVGVGSTIFSIPPNVHRLFVEFARFEEAKTLYNEYVKDFKF